MARACERAKARFILGSNHPELGGESQASSSGTVKEQRPPYPPNNA